MPEWTPADQREREIALDPRRSFIVQAPAGSGKTELLIQRVLALLATVESPEEIVAITFTRKAAGEMRDRIQLALTGAQSEQPPPDAHKQRTWALARAVRARDAQRAWGLEENAGRLRILTIDSLCAALARQMPVLSRFGAPLATVENVQPLYRAAARNTLAALDGDDAQARCVANLLAHVDNDAARAEALLSRMLAQRDQWLRHVADRDAPHLERAVLEAALRRVVEDALARVRTLLPAALADELLAVVRNCAGNLKSAGAADPLIAFIDLDRIPGQAADALDAWRVLVGFVLTKEGTPRKAFNAVQGILAPSGAKAPARKAELQRWKDRAVMLSAALCEAPGLRAALDAVRELPPPRYDDAQWEILHSLIAVLPLAVAHLHLVFRAQRQVDFSAVAQAALRALGEDDAPTDLALALDYRIRHLLVDEFQDTSHAQFDLLTRLTAGWESGDGRTLFIVGDPMQSIYRFREAEVALYLRARDAGVGNVRLEPLRLVTNFRSQQSVIDWVNEAFARLLPQREDMASGAVTFTASQAAQSPLAGPAVVTHALIDTDAQAEARLTVDLVRAALAEGAQRSVAILVRNRKHLAALVPALKAQGLRPHAVDIDALNERAVIGDLHALTRALMHPADRIAWLSVLRAPWCGLTLADLDALARHDARAGIADLLRAPAVMARLSDDGRQRAARLSAVLSGALHARCRGLLARRVEGAWLLLGGPATLRDAAELEDARVYFELLAELERGGDIADTAVLAERVEALFAVPDAGADTRLMIMTMHKAKGLEFDVVILSGLGGATKPRDPQLLMWMERETETGADLLLAPMQERGAKHDPLSGYLLRLDAAKARNEDARLLYVAATRARRRLHLIGRAERKDATARPAPNSLLACLWPVVEGDYAAAYAALAPRAETPALPRNLPAMPLRRLPIDWRAPQPLHAVASAAVAVAADDDEAAIEFSWASETARHVGTVVHAYLQRFAEEGLPDWSVGRLAQRERAIARDLRARGVPQADLDDAGERVLQALGNVLGDPRARWLMSAHAQAKCELPLTTMLDGEMVKLVIDRTFVDEAGTRWIVDYKTGRHEGGELEVFLDREQLRYREQLERYALVMRRIDARPIRMALYFPLLQAWREWD